MSIIPVSVSSVQVKGIKGTEWVSRSQSYILMKLCVADSIISQEGLCMLSGLLLCSFVYTGNFKFKVF